MEKIPLLVFFSSVTEDQKFAICGTCKQNVSCGGSTTNTFNTSNLVSHSTIKYQNIGFYPYRCNSNFKCVKKFPVIITICKDDYLLTILMFFME